MQDVYLKLYDFNESKKQGKLSLPRLITFEERLSYINENIFNVKKYDVYYTQCPNRWLGIKIVNRPVKNENVKFTLDFVTGYLLNSKEHNAHHIKKRYLELLSLKSLDVDFTPELQNELSEIQKDIIYHKPSKSFAIGKNLVFIINKKYELFIQNCLVFYQNALKNSKNSNYTTEYVLDKTVEVLETLHQIKSEARENVVKIVSLKSRRNDLKQIIKEDYLKVKLEKTAIVSSIIKNSIELKQINDEIKYTDERLAVLQSEYMFLTEL